MTESEYIRVSDLRTIRTAILTLRELLPEVNTCIEMDEFRSVMRILSRWQERLHASINLKVREFE